MTGSVAAAGSGPRLGRGVLALMSVTAGLCAGSNYFNQPLLDSIAAAFRISGSAASWTVTIAQVAYTLGLVFLVPSGDLVRRRRLVVGLIILTAVGLGISGFATSLPSFLVGLVLSCLCSVACQVLVAFGAALSSPERRAATTGTVMSGILIGILVARAVSGILSSVGGWQTVYRLAAVLLVIVAVSIRFVLPVGEPAPDRPRYWEALRSMPVLLVRYPRLATRTAMGGLTFAGASVVFATMALQLSAAPFSLSDFEIGLVGLVGVAGAVAAAPIGRGVDRGLEIPMGAVALGAMALCWIDFATFGRSGLVAFVVGMVLLDLGVQGVHVSNQGIIQSLDGGARSRITAIYMTGYFLGAALGSAVGAGLWSTFGWAGTCAAGAAFLALAVAAWIVDVRWVARHRPARLEETASA